MKAEDATVWGSVEGDATIGCPEDGCHWVFWQSDPIPTLLVMMRAVEQHLIAEHVTAPSQRFIIWDNALGVQCGSGKWENYFNAAAVCREFNRREPGGRWGVRHEDGSRVNVDVQMAREERES